MDKEQEYLWATDLVNSVIDCLNQLIDETDTSDEERLHLAIDEVISWHKAHY